MLLSLALIGCSPTNPPPSNDTLSAAQIMTLMHSAHLNGYSELINDREYTLVTVDWIRGPFADQFRLFLDKENLWAYEPESNDCDKFAGWARLFAQKLNNETSNQGKRALAFGEFNYIKDDFNAKGGHAINFGIIRNPKQTNDYQIIFFEPQTGKTVPLTKDEMDSCTAWIL